MTKLNWHAISHTELSLLLKRAALDDSRAVGTSTVYHLSLEGHDVLAVSLPDGQAVIIEPEGRPKNKRRRIDPEAP